MGYEDNNYKESSFYVRYTGLNRKRQIIDKTLEELSNMQMDMIEEAVACSEYYEALEVINYIKGKL